MTRLAGMNILVLGLGNILLGDEGVGVRVVEAMAADYTFDPAVDLVDGGTSGMDMIDIVAERDHVIVVDAVNTGAAPGTVVRLTGGAVPAFFRNRISPHQLGLSDLLAALALMDRSPKDLTLIGCVPQSMATALELTPTVAARVPEMLAMLVDTLAGLGVQGGKRRLVSLLLLDEPVAPGDYLLIQVGNFAFQRMSPGDGRQARALLGELVGAA